MNEQSTCIITTEGSKREAPFGDTFKPLLTKILTKLSLQGKEEAAEGWEAATPALADLRQIFVTEIKRNH